MDHNPPVIATEEEFAFAINTPMFRGDFSSEGTRTHLALIGATSSGYTLEETFLGTIEPVVLADDNDLVSIFVPRAVSFSPAGCYRMIIYNPDTKNVYMVSNVIQVMGLKEAENQTVRLEYRSNGNIFDFPYKKELTFFNKIRVRAVPHQPEPVEIPKGFDTIGELYVRTRSVVKKLVAFALIWLDREDHFAFAAATLHDVLRIDGTRYRRDEAQRYTPAWVDGGGMGKGFEAANAEIILEDIEYTEQNNYC